MHACTRVYTVYVDRIVEWRGSTHSLAFFLGPGLPRGLGAPLASNCDAVLFIPGFGPGTPFLFAAALAGGANMPFVGAGVPAAFDSAPLGVAAAAVASVAGVSLAVAGAVAPLLSSTAGVASTGVAAGDTSAFIRDAAAVVVDDDVVVALDLACSCGNCASFSLNLSNLRVTIADLVFAVLDDELFVVAVGGDILLLLS